MPIIIYIKILIIEVNNFFYNQIKNFSRDYIARIDELKK